jgi:centromere protein K
MAESQATSDGNSLTQSTGNPEESDRRVSSDNSQEGSQVSTEESAHNLLKRECESLWTELHKQQDLLKSCFKPTVAENEDPLVSIYAAKEKLLKAHAQVEENSPPNVLPNNPEILEALLEEDLKKSIAELQSTLDFVTAQHNEMKEELNSEIHDEEIQHALEQKLEELVNQQEEPSGDSRMLQKLKQQEAKAIAYNKKLMKQMFEFIHTHFPPPNEDDLAKWNQKQKAKNCAQIRRNNGVISLRTLIENLVNQSLDEPRNPYVTLTNDHWPPYIELLVRCGVAQHHPDDDRKLRITPVHL